MSATHSVAGPAVAALRPDRMLDRLSGIFRAWKNRRAFHRLGELSDAELADIGLTRADLHVAVDTPLGSDPTARLRAIAGARTSTGLRGDLMGITGG